MGLGIRPVMMEGIEQVFCTHCKQYRPVSDFTLRTPILGLYQYYCRPCQAEVDHANRQKRIERRGGGKKARREENPELGYCAHCKKWKSKDQFNFFDVKKGTLQYYCRDCQHEVDREHYVKHHQRIRDRNKAAAIKSREIAREYVFEYLLTHPYADCGERDPVVLTFDHHNGDKRDDVASMVGQGRALDTIKAEIAKCEVVCHNCHSRRTQQRHGSYRWRKANGG